MIFVTGGTGLLGSHLLVELTQQNDAIVALYRSSSKVEQVKKVFDYYLKDQAKSRFEKITWKEGDVLDVPRLEELMEGAKHVYHCAAIVSFERKAFNKMMNINRQGTENVVNCALHHKVAHFCHISSTSAVGNKSLSTNELINEDAKWVNSVENSGYSVSKYSSEKEVWRGIQEGLNAVIVNPSIVFGAGNWNDSSLKIFRTVAKGLKFYSTGSNAFVDARDVAKIMVLLVEQKVTNERFLCVGENASFKTVFDLIAQKLGKKPPKYKVSPLLMGIAWRLSSFWAAITFSSPTITRSSAKNAFSHTRFDNSKIKKQLNYSFYSLEESIQNAVEGRI